MPSTDANTAMKVRLQPPRVPDALRAVETGAAMCVLASGSSGNCTALALRRGMVVRVALIDLGLSPRRTFKLLADRGLRPDQIDDAIVTHLDADHFHPTWLTALPAHARLRMHERHARRLRESPSASAAERIHAFEESPFDIDAEGGGITVRPLLMSHDEQGVSTLRIDMPGLNAGALGFCTDLGHVTADLIDHLRADDGVDVLALESNYCPRMQLASDRPAFLKQRIMGGSGHLSNQEALEAVRAISPREHVVLLHLSRQCNHPALVADLHAGGDYALTIADQYNPTRWIRLTRGERPLGRPVVSTRLAQTRTLWSAERP
jgi:ribonuclease BN (tRNA processing enzyme)